MTATSAFPTHRTHSLTKPIAAGATAEVWLSDLSTGNVARIAANKFIPLVDVCTKLSALKKAVRVQYDLPRKCPVRVGKAFQFDHTLGASFWEAVEDYKDRVVGASGVLELRLWDAPPCTVCFSHPSLLVGVTLPFKVEKKMVKTKTKKKKKKQAKTAGEKTGQKKTGKSKVRHPRDDL